MPQGRQSSWQNLSSCSSCPQASRIPQQESKSTGTFRRSAHLQTGSPRAPMVLSCRGKEEQVIDVLGSLHCVHLRRGSPVAPPPERPCSWTQAWGWVPVVRASSSTKSPSGTLWWRWDGQEKASWSRLATLTTLDRLWQRPTRSPVNDVVTLRSAWSQS